MPKPIAVVTSDCHLQERAWSSRTTLEGDAAWAFEFIVDKACELKVPIIAAGDIIDKQKNGSSVPGFLRRMMDRCAHARVGFMYIQGQHELQEDPWLSELSSWPEWLGGSAGAWCYLNAEDSHKVSGIDWTPVGELEEQLMGVPEDTNILVMHQVCSEFMGSICTPELSWHMIPSHVKLLIVGDYHGEHVRLEKERPDGSKLIVLSCGSTCMQAIDEPVGKSFFVLNDDLSTQSVMIPSRPFLRPPDLLLDEDLDDFVEKVGGQVKRSIEKANFANLPQNICEPIVYVRYRYDIKDAYKRLKNAIGDGAHFFHKELRPKTVEQVAAREERKRTIDGGLLGSLQEVAQDTASRRYKMSHRLLSAKNPREELTKMREEILNAEG